MDKIAVRKIVESEILEAVYKESGRRIVPVAVSARHVHLSREHINRLFGEGYELTLLKNLSQPGQFACEERVTIRTRKGEIKNVRVLGPERPDTQVEISVTDAFKLGIKPTLKMSGDVEGTPGCTLIAQNASVEIPRGVMVATRHLHISPEQAEGYDLKDGQSINIRIDGQRGTVFENVAVRAGNGHELEIHIDTDEANCAMVSAGAYAEIIE